jgi:hypothetical protein
MPAETIMSGTAEDLIPFFTSAYVGYAVGHSGIIIKTTNGEAHGL